jgi:hypothetical protein
MISFSRVAAICTIIAIFLLFSIAVLLGIQSIGVQITHGSEVEHEHGVILSKSDVNTNLIFQTDSGQIIHFACEQRCLTELEHIQRHIDEHASTDVYYKQENNIFVAVDVD